MLYPVHLIIDPDLDPDLRGYMTITSRDGENTSSVTALVHMTNADGNPTLTGDDLVFAWTSRGPADGRDEPAIGSTRFDRYGRRWERLAEPEGWGTDDAEGLVRSWAWLVGFRGPLKAKIDPKRDTFPPEPSSPFELCTCAVDHDGGLTYVTGCPVHDDVEATFDPEHDVLEFQESHLLVDELQELGIDPDLADELLNLHDAPYTPIELDDADVPTESAQERRERAQREAVAHAEARRQQRTELFGGEA